MTPFIMLTNLVQYHDPLGLQNGHSPTVIFFIVTWNTTIKKNFLTSNFHLANNAVHIHRQEKSLVLSSYLPVFKIMNWFPSILQWWLFFSITVNSWIEFIWCISIQGSYDSYWCLNCHVFDQWELCCGCFYVCQC